MSKKISQLNELTTVLDADILPVVNSGATKKVTKQNLLKEIVTALGTKADTSHIHDDRYYTESEINAFLSSKSDTGHIHDDRYYTEAEITNLLTPYFHKTNDDTDDITVGTTNKFATAAEKTKLGYITITQAVDLDTIESRVNALDTAVVLKGAWDASAGTFPGAGSAQAGDSYIVSVAGTVGGVAFNVNDRLLAILDNASTTTYAANWLKLDYTDQVLSVAGKTGAVTLQTADITDITSSAAELNILDGATLSTAELNYLDGVTSAIQTQLNAKGDVSKVGTPVNNQIGVWTGNGTIEGSPNLTFDGNSVALQTSSAAAVPLTIKGATSQSANYFEIKRSDNATLFSFDEDSVGGVLGIHANNGTLTGFYRINPGGAVNGLDLGGYSYLNLVNQASPTAELGIKAFGNAGGLIDIKYYTYYSNVFFSGYTGAGTNGGEVVINDLQSSTEVFHSYSSDNSNKGVRFPTGKVIIGGSGVPDAKFQVVSTTNLMRLGYDASNYLQVDVSSAGAVTFDAVGSSARFIFNDRVNIPTSTPSSVSATGTTGDIAWDTNYIYVAVGTDTWRRATLSNW